MEREEIIKSISIFIGVSLILVQYILIPFEKVIQIRNLFGPIGSLSIFPLFMGIGFIVLGCHMTSEGEILKQNESKK